VRMVDTAGLRDATGKVEAIGIERARARAGAAHLILLLEDIANPQPVTSLATGVPLLRIGTKADLMAVADRDYDLTISSTTGAGLSELLGEIGRRAAAAIGGAGDVLPSRLRHVELLAETRTFLSAAIAGSSQELRAEELRLAADRLGRIIGAVDVEDLLDVIFSQFCIGK